MKILHTADWHLGATLHELSLVPEQERFLAWLLDLIAADEVDLLLVAGDIYDQAHPSAEAQRLYYDFFGRLEQRAPRCQAIVIAGNHDSAQRLAAPQTLLRTRRVEVIAAVPPPGQRGALLIPAGPDPNHPAVIVAAVPYARDQSLGFFSPGRTQQETHQAYTQGFRDLYASLADEAAERWPGVPRIAMGHLTVQGQEAPASDDWLQNIHVAARFPETIGNISALPAATLFDERWDYVALGHIHRGYPVLGQRVWYSGTPVPVSVKEGMTPRMVRVLELQATESDTTHTLLQRNVEVPRWRDIRRITGTREEVMRALKALPLGTTLRPLYHLEVRVEDYDPGLPDALGQIVADRWGASAEPPQLKVTQHRETTLQDIGSGTAAEALRSLDEYTPDEVFQLMYQARHKAPAPAEVMEAFRLIVEEEAQS